MPATGKEKFDAKEKFISVANYVKEAKKIAGHIVENTTHEEQEIAKNIYRLLLAVEYFSVNYNEWKRDRDIEEREIQGREM